MFPILFNSVSAIISFSAMFGVFVHDTQLLKLANVVGPIDVTSFHSNDTELLAKSSQHVHMVSSSLSSVSGGQQISIQPRNENDKKYLSQRKTTQNNDDSDYFWPSI
jgi:hypothetical protein